MELEIIYKGMFKAYTILACIRLFKEFFKYDGETYDTRTPYDRSQMLFKMFFSPYGLNITLYGVILGYCGRAGWVDDSLSNVQCQVALILFFLSLVQKP